MLRLAVALTVCVLASVGGAAEPPLARAQALAKRCLELQGQVKLLAAKKTADEALALAEKALGKDHADLVPFIDSAARLSQSTGDLATARRLFARTLAIVKRTKGLASDDVARALQMVGLIDWQRGSSTVAEPLLLEGLAIYEKNHGTDDSIYVASYLEMLGAFYRVKYDLGKAERAHLRVLAMREKKSGKDATELVGPLYSLAWVHLTRGDHVGAEPYLQRIIAIYDKHPEQAETATATFLDQLADTYERQARVKDAAVLWARSEAVLLRLLASAEKDPGPNRWKLPFALESLAAHFQRRKLPEKALPYLYRSMAERESQGNPLSLVGPLMSIAAAEDAAGRPAKAIPLYERAGMLQKAAFGGVAATGPDLMMARSLERLGDFRRAKAALERAVKEFERMYGVRHPMIGGLVASLSAVAWADGDPKRAYEHLRRAIELVEPQIALVLATGLEADRRAYLDSVAYQVDQVVAEALAFGTRELAELTLTTVLRRKGRLLDAMADTMGRIRGRLATKSDQKLFESLQEARGRLSRLVLAGPGQDDPAEYQREVAALESQIKALEVEIGERNADFKTETTPVTPAAVRAALPRDGVLIEFISTKKLSPKNRLEPMDSQPRRYAAMVLGPAGPIGTPVDLGDAEPLEKRVAELRLALSDPSHDPKAAARALDEALMRPIRARLGSSRRLFLSPDAALNVVPFGALIDENGQYLVQRYVMSYVTSGRDLLRKRANGGRHGAVIIANPDFDGGNAPKAPAGPELASASRRRSQGYGSLRWSPLPGTADEVKAIGKVLPKATALTGNDATEAALKALHGPRVLHIATHGFFLPDPKNAAQREENPLLRSGLCLSGANALRGGGDEDGVLTALEAAGLDLQGTALVVLSACESGLGDVRAGDGVYGLSRALVIAGAEGLVLSLWQVDDTATRDLMIRFYRRLAANVDRADALREAQISLLASEDRSHPYYWAAFVPSGLPGTVSFE